MIFPHLHKSRALLSFFGGLSLSVVSCGDKPSPPAPKPAASVEIPPEAAAMPASIVPPAKPVPVTITLSAVGDCTLGAGIENGFDQAPFDLMMARHSNDMSYPFSGVLDLFRSDDITIVNLEGTLTTATEPIAEGKFHFRGKPEYARILKESSVEIANIANNHAGDFGVHGQIDTRKALLDAGVGISGNGIIDRRIIRGVEVVNVGFTGVHMTPAHVKTDIGTAKKPDNVVIASFHWGMEGTHEVIDIQREFGRMAIDAGADVVLGHHPHVVQALEVYQGKHIIHSLGNFVFGANTNPKKLESMVYRATFVLEEGRIKRGPHEVFPVRLCAQLPCTEFRPVLMNGQAKQDFLAWFANENEKLAKRPYPTARR